jgi:CDP-4-dehydro-6-deoxyglucose reductase, E1
MEIKLDKIDNKKALDIENILKNSLVDKDDESSELRQQILQLVKNYSKIAHTKKIFNPGSSLIPVSGRTYNDLDLKMLVASSLDFWLTAGRFNKKFEEHLAQFLNVDFTLTVNSGSSANLIAVSSLTSDTLGERALKPGDEIITVAAGFPTTVNPIIQNNLIPVFVDVNIPEYSPDIDSIKKAITNKTKAIIFAHTLGNPFQIIEVMEIAKKHNLWVIEDCCDALGSTVNGQHVGTFGDIGTLSFYPAHQITMGEGGAIFTNNSNLKRIMESFRDWGRDCFCEPGKNNTCGKRFEWKLGDLPFGYDHKYTYSNPGYNLKITEMQAAIGVAQLTHLPEFIKKRKINFRLLTEGLEIFNNHLILPKATPNSEPSWFGFPITVKENTLFSKNELISFLNSKLIDTRSIFAGNITKQPYFKNVQHKIVGNLTNTDIIMNNSFWIGVYPGITEEMIEYVIKQFEQFFKSI